MELKFIDNPVRLQAFLNEPGNTENIVEPGHTYYIKPDAVYLGIYEGLVLAGVHEVRNFWHSVVECHAVYDPGFRGEYALQGHRLFCKWLLENSPFLNSITMVPDTTKYGRAIIRLLGAKANAARIAGEMRRAITDDMRIMAEKGNFLTEWQKANDLSKSYIIAKQNAESVFGRDLASDAMVRKGADTLKASANTGTGAFHRLISALPEAERQPAIASILQHAVAQGEKGGIGEESGIQYFAKLMTQQNVNAISRHAPDLGRMMKEFGVLAKASTRPQRYVERTGRTTEALKTLDSGLPKIVGVIMNGVQQSGAIAGGFGGGVIGSISGLVAGGALRNTVAKIGATRSGRYAIEKAVQEATKAVRAGASPAAIAAAEKRFSANKIAMKAIRDAVGAEEFVKLTRAGIVATLSGMKDVSEWE